MLAILGAAYTITRADAQEQKERAKLVRKRSLRDTVVHAWQLLRAHARERRRAKQPAGLKRGAAQPRTLPQVA